MKGEVVLSSPKQWDYVPVKNRVDRIGGLLYLLGKTTRRSSSPGFERPITLRTTRAQLYKAYKVSRGESSARDAIIREADERDRLAREFLNQRQVTVSVAGEEQSAQFTILTPRRTEDTQDNISKPAIVIIPGISCDVDCVDAFAEELAFRGRKVTVVGYPESFMGNATERFAEAVENSSSYKPHAEFFMQAITALMKDQPIELWGFSTGSTIAANILSDPDFQQQVTSSVLLSPVGLIDQKKSRMARGLFLEAGRIIKQINSLGRYVYTYGRSDQDVQESQEERSIKRRIFGGLLKNIEHRSSAWNTMHVNGGNIVVVSSEKDSVTNSKKGLDNVRGIPQVRILRLAHGSHNTPLINPRVVVPEIFQAQLV
ncbi:MAG: alpha/beta hydrolase [Patescibacteria group bacterium]|nr:alpha/beta hydrolase [Patescibacteria group bacterium]